MSSLKPISPDLIKQGLYHSNLVTSKGSNFRNCEILINGDFKFEANYYDKPLEFILYFDKRTSNKIPAKVTIGSEIDKIDFYFFKQHVNPERIYIQGAPYGKYSRVNFNISFPKEITEQLLPLKI